MIKKFSTVFCLLMLFTMPSEVIASAETHVYTIANSSVGTSTLSKLNLRRIFAMRQQNWSNGQPIIVYVLANESDIHQRFCKEVLGIFPYQLNRIWDKLTYSGIGTAPIVVNSPEALLLAVQNTTGSVGYSLGKPVGDAVHVIEIE